MTTERCKEIAIENANVTTTKAKRYNMKNDSFLLVGVGKEPGYYNDTDYVCYISIIYDDGYIETHTAKPGNVEEISFWISSFCYNTEEV